MRVYELARELGVESAAVLAALQASGHDVVHASEKVSASEAEAARAALGGSPASDATAAAAPPLGASDSVPLDEGDRREGEGDGSGMDNDAGPRYRLVGKASVRVGALVVERSSADPTVSAAAWRRLPARVRRSFEPA